MSGVNRSRMALAALLASCLFDSPVLASQTTTYRFLPGQSTITQTGGIAGIQRTYTISGTFQLTLDSAAGTASFDRVDAKAVDDSPDQHTLDPNEVFNMTDLAGVTIDTTTIRFEGTADDGSSVLLTLTFDHGTVTLKGGTTPPPNSADFFVFTLGAQAARAGQTDTYAFLTDKSTITQTGGIAGIQRTYTITGTFQLTADFEAGTATFDQVDANAVDDSPDQHTLDPNDVFNMTDLAGVIIDRTTTRFEGTADDGSSILITLSFADGTVTLKGQTTPPPDSADFFIFALDAVAQRKYSGGTGEPNDPYQIATAADLIALGETPDDYDKHFLLTADIDLDPNLPGRKVFDKAVIAPQGTSFTGVFDGNSHMISHLTITGHSYLGLFGQLDLAMILDIGLEAVDINGAGSNIGGLVGSNGFFGTIITSYSSGVVSGDSGIGGLVGSNGFFGSIVSSYSSGAVTGGDYVGGLVGYNQDGGIVSSYSNSVVTGGDYVGGLVGYSEYGGIVASYSAGVVDGNDWVGGLTGETYAGTIRDCYSVAGVAGLTGVGGLIGASYAEDGSGDISRCYSAGPVTGKSSVGGLVGKRFSGTVTASFWDSQTSGKATSAGGTGKTTAQMQTAKTFLDAGWDFVGETANGTEDIWWILEGKDYPRLSWQLPADDFADGKVGPLWFVYEVDPQLVQIKERNGRLEMTASAEAQNVDAFYISDGWRLDATKPFAIKVDFHFNNCSGGDGRVTFGVLPILDPAAMKWAELEAGCFESGPFYLYEVRDGSWVQEVVAERSSNDGTLYMSYDPDVDELYLSYTGFGKANNWRMVVGLLKGRWASAPVYVILGGGSEGMALSGPDAWLDNFAVSSGVLVLN